MANIYTVVPITTPETAQSAGLLNNPANFPPSSNLYLTIEPLPGEIISAANFYPKEVLSSGSTIPMILSLQGNQLANLNSHTQWPSRFEWSMDGLGNPDSNTQSGFVEFPAFYKVVITDSENPLNTLAFTPTTSNKVYVWIYFGRNEVMQVTSTFDMVVNLDIDYSSDPVELNDVTGTNIPSNNINNFEI